MALNKSLNATCDLDGYLFYRMPAEALKVEIKVKTKWGSLACSMTPILEQKSIMLGKKLTGGANRWASRARTQVSPSGLHRP